MTTTLTRIDFMREAATMIRQTQASPANPADYRSMPFSDFLDCIYGKYDCLNPLRNLSEQFVVEKWAMLFSEYLKHSGVEGASDIRETLAGINDIYTKITLVYGGVEALKETIAPRTDNYPTPIELQLSILFNVRFTPTDVSSYRSQIETVVSNAGRLITSYKSSCNTLKRLLNQHYINPGEAHRLLVCISKTENREVALNTITAGEVAAFNRLVKAETKDRA